MLAYKGTLDNRTSKWGFSYPTEYELTQDYHIGTSAIHACPDPYMVFLYGCWTELWLVDLDVIDHRPSVLSGNKIKFLKQLTFSECLVFTKDTALLAYYWVVNFVEQLSEDTVNDLLVYVVKNEECVISWAENIGTHLPSLSEHIVTPRYAYLWRLEGFPMNARLVQLADEYVHKAPFIRGKVQ